MGESRRRASGDTASPKYAHSQGHAWTYCQNLTCGPCGNIYMGRGRMVGQAFGKAHAADLGLPWSAFAGAEEQMANLRLMTAAPTMLIALEVLMRCQDHTSIEDVREIARRAVQVALVGAQELQ